MNSKAIALIIVAVILSAIGYIWFINNFEEVEKIKWRGIQGKAQADKFYVAEEFLRKKGLDVTRTKTLNPVNKTIAPYHTIFMGKTKYALTPTETQALLKWTQDGNTLIVQGQKSDDNFITDKLTQSKGLLEQAGITVKYCGNDECECKQSDDIEYAEKVPADNNDNDKKNTADNETIDDKLNKLLSLEEKKETDSFIANGQPIILNKYYSSYQYKTTGNTKKLLSQKGNCGKEMYAVFQYGQGKIIVYSQNQEFFHTDNLRRFSYLDFWDTVFNNNNATYLYWLLHQNGDPQRILWYESQTFPSVVTIIWQYWRPTVIMLLILILAWVWRYSPRFGSLLVESETKSLSIARHLHATGQFYYDSNAKDILLASCFEHIENHIAKRVPMANQLSTEKLIEKIATLTDLPMGKVAQVVYRRIPNTEAEFIEITQIINHIREKL